MRFREPIETPHLALPLAYQGGQVEVVEQDTLEEVSMCVEAVLRYRKGSRPEAPTFGINDQAFVEGGADLDHIAETVAEIEPRGSTLIERAGDDLAQAEQLEDGIEAIRVAVQYTDDPGPGGLLRWPSS